MTLGACLVSNDPATMKDAFIQARIDGKSWKQIQEEFGFSSVQTARKTFRKVTGINNLKIKGKELKKVIDAGLIDDLKKVVPKKPKVPDSWPAPANTQAATTGAQSTGKALGDEMAKLYQDAFPDQGGFSLLKTTTEKVQFAHTNGGLTFDKANDIQIKALKGIAKPGTGLTDVEVANKILADIKVGKYYSSITQKYGVSFAEVDGIYWGDAVNNAVANTVRRKATWKAYKAKPTSEFGFKAVQDEIWNLRKAGISIDDIADLSGVDKHVVNLIVENKWKLPAKGSNKYVGFPSSASSPSYTSTASAADASFSQTASQVVGEGSKFKNMTKTKVHKWADELGNDLSPGQYQAYKGYTGADYHDINDLLRGRGGSDSQLVREKTRQISEGMSRMPSNQTLHRASGKSTFKEFPKVGDAWTDPGFTSTSYGSTPGYGNQHYIIHIDVPKGARARPLSKLSSHGEREREILLDRNQRYIITGVKERAQGKADVYMKLIVE